MGALYDIRNETINRINHTINGTFVGVHGWSTNNTLNSIGLIMTKPACQLGIGPGPFFGIIVAILVFGAVVGVIIRKIVQKMKKSKFNAVQITID